MTGVTISEESSTGFSSGVRDWISVSLGTLVVGLSVWNFSFRYPTLPPVDIAHVALTLAASTIAASCLFEVAPVS